MAIANERVRHNGAEFDVTDFIYVSTHTELKAKGTTVLDVGGEIDHKALNEGTAAAERLDYAAHQHEPFGRTKEPLQKTLPRYGRNRLRLFYGRMSAPTPYSGHYAEGEFETGSVTLDAIEYCMNRFTIFPSYIPLDTVMFDAGESTKNGKRFLLAGTGARHPALTEVCRIYVEEI